jgi:pimeloyl-ACP methyl ester esterase
MVLLHGWGYGQLAWPEDWLERLGQHYRLLLVDLPGHGSDSHALGCPAETLSNWTRALLQVIPDQAVVMGWSLGGMLALQLAHQVPQQLAGLVLLASNIKFVQCVDWPWALPVAELDYFRQEFRRTPSKTLRRFCSLQVQGEQDSSLLRHLSTQLDPQPSVEGLDWLQQLDLRHAWCDLSIPCLALYGTDDVLVPAEVQLQLARLQPAACMHTFRGGHAFFWRNDQVLDQVEIFLHHCLVKGGGR